MNAFFSTPRLRARRMRLDDLEAFVRYRSDPTVARFQSWETYSPEQGRRLISSMEGVDPGVPGEWFQVALESREDGSLVGDLALHVSADDRRQAEIGFTLSPAAQGRGLATEALRGYLDWLFLTYELHRVHAVTDALNAPAAALLSRVGFRREAHHVENVWFKGAWGSEYVFALLRHEWPREPSG